ncbi:hypothetical protein GUJ93_ZPchr0011g27057 [Zizania palustris]|uniref:NB-ARC domain-containing protein n=1 Tax=Zizania palustris TaxID=103762 RepID=A0A8J6BQH2_ZIZPA|nr:hypothetical protein GUJ93_ZPchr0011g27057 [Zizania palustris]
METVDSIEEEQRQMLEALRVRIRKLLEPGRVTGDRGRHWLAFTEMEASALLAESRRSVLARGIQFLEAMVDVIEDDHDFLGKKVGKIGEFFMLAHEMHRRMLNSHQLFHEYAYLFNLVVEECCGYKTQPQPQPQATKECDLVGNGIDGQANNLLTVAADDNKSLRVTCIVGPRGVGKTTLAMELYRRLRRKTAHHFQCCAAATFSPPYYYGRRRLLLESILSQAQLELVNPETRRTISSYDDGKEMLLARSIREQLQDKRYLILIDGICDESDWEIIKDAFPNNKCGSRILITTRDESMIRMYRAEGYDVEVHNMEPLNESDSERLLRTTAFGSMDDCPPDNLKLLCDEILRQCQGIPLFIICMADWLKQHQQQHKSSAVHSTKQVSLLLKQFRQILLSFEEDYELSQTSLHLSMFPLGCVFDKYRRFSEITHFDWFEIFSEMVDKNIITPVAENCSPDVDDDESCQWQVNPIMHHFFVTKAAEAGFAFTSTTLASATGSSKMTRRARVRRLALHHPDPQLPGMLKEMDLSQTRSLLISSAVERISIPLDKFAYLVVLDLQGWENLKDEDLLQICTMFMLRYLSVRNTRISRIPPQIKELRNLRTLNVSHTLVSELPSEIRELRNLRTLNISHTLISELPSQMFELMKLKVIDLRGTKISRLPEQFERLWSHLSTLLVGGNGVINSDETVVVTKIPESVIKRATDLERLATMDLSECSASYLEVLGDKEHLDSLAITLSFHQCTDGAYQNILLSTIQKLRDLTSLTIHCGLGCSMEFLGSLNHPLKLLEKLKVTGGRFVRVPQWIGRLEELTFLQITICRLVPDNVKILANLKKLHITICTLEQDDVKILANLQKLERLVLGLEFIPEKEIAIEYKCFKELERFCLDCPVPWLTFKQGAMPKLQLLQLKICSGPANQRTAVPSGLTNLGSITEIVICYSKWCSNSSSVKRTVEAVRKQVAMHRNGVHLVINGIQEYKEAVGSVTKNECGSEDVEAFGEKAESRAECSGTKDDFDAADDEKEERRATHIQSEIEIEEVECETEIHA